VPEVAVPVEPSVIVLFDAEEDDELESAISVHPLKRNAAANSSAEQMHAASQTKPRVKKEFLLSIKASHYYCGARFLKKPDILIKKVLFMITLRDKKTACVNSNEQGCTFLCRLNRSN
jgi:hypothetical protein